MSKEALNIKSIDKAAVGSSLASSQFERVSKVGRRRLPAVSAKLAGGQARLLGSGLAASDSARLRGLRDSHRL